MDQKELLKSTLEKMSGMGLEEDRIQMAKYMKNHFDFFGVKSPIRKSIQKEIRNEWKQLTHDQIFSYAEALWDLPQRELQYIALDALGTRAKKLDESFLPRTEKLILKKSWWDTVDSLAPNIAGAIFFNSPSTRLEWVEKWNNSDNMWLNRSALIHQLRYKEKVDLDLLFALIETHIDSKEFFINKASGWALRQASKFHPLEIKQFILNHPNLSNLSRKEGSKYLG